MRQIRRFFFRHNILNGEVVKQRLAVAGSLRVDADDDAPYDNELIWKVRDKGGIMTNSWFLPRPFLENRKLVSKIKVEENLRVGVVCPKVKWKNFRISLCIGRRVFSFRCRYFERM